MDTSRLLALVEDLIKELESGFEAQLDSIITLYTQARDNPSADQSKQIAAARSKLSEVLKKSRVNEFVPSQTAMLEKMGFREFFGREALARLNEVLDAPGMGPAPIVTNLEQFRTYLQQTKKSMNQTKQGLTGIGVQPARLRPDEREVGLVLPETVTSGELGSLGKHINGWNQTLKAIWELTGQRGEISVRSTGTGSIEIFVLASIAAADWITKIIERAVNTYVKIQEVRAVKEKLADLDFDQKAVTLAEQREKALIAESISGLVGELLKDRRGDGNKIEKTRLPELEKQLKNGIQRGLKLVDEGGTIEVSIPDLVEEQFVTPITDDGQPLPPDKVQQAQKDWEDIQLRRRTEHAQAKLSGAAVAKLPSRPSPILHLPEPEDGDEKPNGEKAAKPKPKAKA